MAGRPIGPRTRAFDTIEEFEAYLDWAIGDAMQNEIAEEAIEQLQETGERKVYSYKPKFNSRREESGGGLISTDTMFPDYEASTKTLTVSLNAEWQNLSSIIRVPRIKGGADTSQSLADAIQTQTIYHAPARPFVQEAEDKYAAKKFGTHLVRALNRRGL